MKSLCFASAGASKLQELTIIAKSGDQDSSHVDLTDILWPLLLRSDITVKFEGINADPEKTSTETSPEIDAVFCRRIALLRRLCNDELTRPCWEERRWEFNGFREAEMALYALELPGTRLCLHDIVSMSSVWKGLQHEIDRAESSLSGL